MNDLYECDSHFSSDYYYVYVKYLKKIYKHYGLGKYDITPTIVYKCFCSYC